MIKIDFNNTLKLHKLLTDFTGGCNEIRDYSLLDSALNTALQTVEGKELYPSLEEKGARLGFNLVQNHAFIDGNKRIAASIFLYFMNFYGLLYRDGKTCISNNTLAALTLLIAESKADEKELIIDVVMNIVFG